MRYNIHESKYNLYFKVIHIYSSGAVLWGPGKIEDISKKEEEK